MKKIKLAQILILLIFMSCENESDFVSENVGEYVLESLTANEALDLNEDGTATTDFYFELKDYFDFIYPLTDRNHIEIAYLEESIYSLQHTIPKVNIDITDNNSISYTNTGGSNITLEIIESSNNQVGIEHFFTEERLLEERWAIVDNVRLINNQKIEVEFRQQFFNENEEWQMIELIGVFTKKE